MIHLMNSFFRHGTFKIPTMLLGHLVTQRGITYHTQWVYNVYEASFRPLDGPHRAKTDRAPYFSGKKDRGFLANQRVLWVCYSNVDSRCCIAIIIMSLKRALKLLIMIHEDNLLSVAWWYPQNVDVMAWNRRSPLTYANSRNETPPIIPPTTKFAQK